MKVSLKAFAAISCAATVLVTGCASTETAAPVATSAPEAAKTLSEGAMYFDLTTEKAVYSDATGFGYDFKTKPQSKKNKTPAYFSVKVPDGNYKVTFELGAEKFAANTTVRVESRRLLVQDINTKKGETQSFTFVVHKRSPVISEGNLVRIKPRERDYLNWDEKLTFEFNGKAPAVKSLTIEPDTEAITLFLCGDSTMVDGEAEPWASWGQMFPTWFNEHVCVANYAESGETSTSFMKEKRWDKVLSMLKEGDYVFVEFGHNDEKDNFEGAGPFMNYSDNLRNYVKVTRERKAHIILLTPTERRFFAGPKARGSHGFYPVAVKNVGKELDVPVIDITQMTTNMIEKYGPAESTHFYVHYPLDSFPGQTSSLKDETHFNPFGAWEISKCVVMGLKQINSPLVSYLREGWVDFDSKNPDRWDQFPWCWAPAADVRKPDGN
ncbi:MAG: rhamnogalacturonan acetylesterase [Treponema sp.]|nr:rhamnogalacturonan acetylesterase [Treponema sp.]